jgi:hypothetical protein
LLQCDALKKLMLQGCWCESERGGMTDPDPQIWLGDDRILPVRYPQNFNLTLEVMEQVHQRRLEIIVTPCPLLVYADTGASAEYEAQQFA